eukprot:SAG31_NODE_2517_length_5576_cov_3.265839_5_plen_92_part_00
MDNYVHHEPPPPPPNFLPLPTKFRWNARARKHSLLGTGATACVVSAMNEGEKLRYNHRRATSTEYVSGRRYLIMSPEPFLHRERLFGSRFA